MVQVDVSALRERGGRIAADDLFRVVRRSSLTGSQKHNVVGSIVGEVAERIGARFLEDGLLGHVFHSTLGGNYVLARELLLPRCEFDLAWCERFPIFSESRP